jgi:transcriptional regulator of NAD metabolism
MPVSNNVLGECFMVSAPIIIAVNIAILAAADVTCPAIPIGTLKVFPISISKSPDIITRACVANPVINSAERRSLFENLGSLMLWVTNYATLRLI